MLLSSIQTRLALLPVSYFAICYCTFFHFHFILKVSLNSFRKRMDNNFNRLKGLEMEVVEEVLTEVTEPQGDDGPVLHQGKEP